MELRKRKPSSLHQNRLPPAHSLLQLEPAATMLSAAAAESHRQLTTVSRREAGLAGWGMPCHAMLEPAAGPKQKQLDYNHNISRRQKPATYSGRRNQAQRAPSGARLHKAVGRGQALHREGGRTEGSRLGTRCTRSSSHRLLRSDDSAAAIVS